MSERVLIVAAHPDDEVLGVGATAARHARKGDMVQPLILAEGATSRGDGATQVQALQQAARAAAQALGTAAPVFGGLPDNRLDTVPLLDVIQLIERIGAEVDPTIVYTHHGGDLNQDHRIAHAAVLTAFRPLPGANWHRILCFETPSSTEWASPGQQPAFQPTYFVDVAATLDAKLAALACYGSEMRPAPHPRSPEAIEALARWRGACAGVAAAEAFAVVREVTR